MDGNGLVVVISLGAAVLALWSYVRWPGAAPASFRGAVVRVLVALALLHVSLAPIGAAAGSSKALAVLAVIGLVVPVLTFAFLTSLWVMRFFADMLRGSV